jgi:deoxyribodipyrimidine photo-lyase
MPFDPTREAGLARLNCFVSKAGKAYQDGRNYDVSPEGIGAVSQLSPWLRHRLISETEVLRAVLNHHSKREAEVFVQEVFWRGYFKGWLEQHPSVWKHYKAAVAQTTAHNSKAYRTAVAGQTGIECFDHWCAALKNDGYLHNHARMWFASIWIFTLRLPWELGAAFFLKHLQDADPASNTLGWRWVAGLHTKGKTYLATADNIAKFTHGRFNPVGGLAQAAPPLEELELHATVPFSAPQAEPEKPHLLVITEEDCLAGDTLSPSCLGILGILSPEASRFAQGALRDTLARHGGQLYQGHNWSAAIETAAQQAKTKHILTAHIPVGPVADGFAHTRKALTAKGYEISHKIRAYDSLLWPHATKGFFKLKKQIPTLLEVLDLG